MIAQAVLATIYLNLPPILDGITLGQNVLSVIKAREIPIDRDNPTVTNTDAGHVWTWTQKDGTIERITTDDQGIIQMIDILASPANERKMFVPVAGSLQFNVDSHVNAQFAAGSVDPALITDEWLPLAHRLGTVLGYVIELDYGVLFAFPGQGDQGLIEIVCGTKKALSTTGMIPIGTPIIQPAAMNESGLGVPPSSDIYKAPKLAWMPLRAGNYWVPRPDATGQFVYVRIAVRSDGRPSSATVFAGSEVPSTSKRATDSVLFEKFEPARLNGKSVPSIYFQKVSVPVGF